MAKTSSKQSNSNNTNRMKQGSPNQPRQATMQNPLNMSKSSVQATSKKKGQELSQEQIAVQAYHIWQQKGCVSGRDAENWFEAVETLRRQQQTRA